MGPASPHRVAYTALELLLAFTILAIVVGLLFPALHKIREAHNRVVCTNNLKHIGAGFHQYHELHGHLPTGGKHQCQPPYHPLMPAERRMFCDGISAEDPRVLGPYMGPWPTGSTLAEQRQEWSWPYHVLPFVEQNELFKNPDASIFPRTALALFHCPTRRPSTLYNEHATIDYAGCAGTNGSNGVIVAYGLPPVAFVQIADGLSSTILVAEKRLKHDRFGHSVDDRLGWATPGWSSEIERRATQDPDRPEGDCGPSPDIRLTDATIFPDIDSPLGQFGSSHQAGVNTLFADGSVRYIRFQPNPSAFQRLCTRSEGAKASPNDL